MSARALSRGCVYAADYRDGMGLAARRAGEAGGDLPRGRRLALAAAVQRSIQVYWYSPFDDPVVFEVATLQAVAEMRRAEHALGRSFGPQDITLAEQVDSDEPMFDVLLCGAEIGYMSLDLYSPQEGWTLWPSCPLMTFSDDVPAPPTPVSGQEHFTLRVGVPGADAPVGLRRVRWMLADEQIAALRDEIAELMISRVRRRLRVGGDREVCVGWRPALPASYEPPVRPPRRLKPRRNTQGRPFGERPWARARRQAGLPV